jgi:hypothetical protein
MCYQHYSIEVCCHSGGDVGTGKALKELKESARKKVGSPRLINHTKTDSSRLEALEGMDLDKMLNLRE